MTQPPQHPFHRIAVSFSGGGYRAASFHLGTLSYLNRLSWDGTPLLHQVRMISTVSGGTIPGVIYTLLKQEDKPFEEIYDFILSNLRELDLLKLSFIKLSSEGRWHTETKRRNIINAFAEIYDEHFTRGKTLSEFRHLDSHLEAVVFNSTEFDNGLNFRFRSKGKMNGSARIKVPFEVAAEIKLSDVLASSSCFPGGFEPMLWPNDFLHKDADRLARHAAGRPAVGLMDGGIYDNQGIESILKYNHSKDKPYFDLVIVSDVSSPNMTRFESGEMKQHRWSDITYGQVTLYSKYFNRVLAVVTAGLFALPFFWSYSDSFFTGFCIGLGLMISVVLFAKIFLLSKLKKLISSQFQKLIGSNFNFYKSKVGPLKIANVPFGTLALLARDRITSLSILMQEVFLKVVRRLNYNKLYEDDRYHFRRITTLIRGLTEDDFTKYKSSIGKDDTVSYDSFVGPKIADTVKAASGFGTTLWFTETENMNDVLHKLVATGQLTLCFNMIIYLNRWLNDQEGHFDRLSAIEQNRIRSLHEQCMEDWTRFRNDPLWMV